MAATVTSLIRQRTDKKFITHNLITLDTTYPTGGESITPNALGLGTIEAGYVPGTVDGYLFQWDNSANKLQAFYCDYDAGADGALIEVTTGADISAAAPIILVTIGS